jgi:hypothetical protein
MGPAGGAMREFKATSARSVFGTGFYRGTEKKRGSGDTVARSVFFEFLLWF